MPEPKTSGTTADHQPSPVRQPAKEAKGRDLGILAVVGVAVCCGLPVLAAIGGVLRNAWIVLAAVIVVVAIVAWRRLSPEARHRR